MRQRQPRKIEYLEPRQLLAAVPSVVDVLVLYTPGALSFHHGDLNELKLELAGAVDSANLAMVNSEISSLFRVAGVQPISYTGSNDLFLDRTRLSNPADGFMDTAPALRNTYGADLVCLVTESTSVGGNASLPTTAAELNSGNFVFSAINIDSIHPGNLTIAHEWGHNLGAGHERGNVSDPAVGPYPYSYGYRFTATDGNIYHDVMSYDPGMGIYNYANPNVSFLGSPTGKPSGDLQSADIAATFAQTAPIVSAFRSPALTNTTTPTASLYQTELAGLQLDFTVRVADPEGVNAANFDNNDITVSLPQQFGGHVLRAGLISVEHGATAGGAFKLVSYRVILPSTDIPLDQLTFSLLGGAVADGLGQTSAATNTISANTASVANIDFANARNIGALTLNGATKTVFESLGHFLGDRDNTYRVTVSDSGLLAAQVSGNTADLSLFIAKDINGNGKYDYPAEEAAVSGNFAPTAPEATVASVVPGTYFVWVFGGVDTNYKLSVEQYTDTTPPTATADTTDLFTTGAPYIDFSVNYTDDHLVNGDTARYWSAIDIHAQLDNGADFTFYYYPEPATNNPYALTGPSHKTNYRIFPFNGTDWTALDNGTFTLSIHANTGSDPRVHDAAGNDIPLITVGSFKIKIGQTDTSPPTVDGASISNMAVPGATTYQFSVDYHDNVALNASTVDNNDVRVTGPGGHNVPATLVSLTAAPAIGGTRRAIYSIVPPGGNWDVADRGVYTVALQANQVRDSAGNNATAMTIGTFNVIVPLPGDANGDRMVNLADFTTLAANFGAQPRGVAGGDFTYDNIVNLADFTVLASRFGQSVPAVSEPPRGLVPNTIISQQSINPFSTAPITRLVWSDNSDAAAMPD